MILESPAFKDGQLIPDKYTCMGESVSPPLIIKDAPQNSQSLALIVDDPDAPSGDFVHWVVFNVDPKINEIIEDSVPSGAIEGITSTGKPGYVGPCPPKGIHHYNFKIYALGIILDLGTSTNKAKLIEAMNGHIIESAQLVGLFEK